jgi:flagellin
MALRIQNNVEAFNAHRNLIGTSEKAAKAMERLSSGYRINRGADDAAGLAISEKLRSQIRGLAQAQRNAQDGVSLVQTAEGSLTEVHSMLQRVRELAVQYQNGTLADADKTAIDNEVQQLSKEITRIGDTAKFNGIQLLDSTSSVTFQVGTADGDDIAITKFDVGASVVGDTSSAAGGTSFSLASATALASIDSAIANVSSARAQFGAVQNRLEYTMNNLATYQENLVASESRIRDVDMAQEMVNFSKLQILQQAGTAMLAQANQAPQGVLSLLR